jgi:hypothetical protein
VDNLWIGAYIESAAVIFRQFPRIYVSVTVTYRETREGVIYPAKIIVTIVDTNRAVTAKSLIGGGFQPLYT